MQGGGGEPEFFVIVLGSPGSDLTEMVVHRPIGVTQLGEQEWVASIKADYEFLLSRKENPAGQEIRESRRIRAFQLASEKGLIQPFKDASTDITWPSGHNRTNGLKDAKALLKSNSPNTLNDVGSGELVYLSKEDAQAEQKLREFLQSKTVLQMIEKEIPDSFETCGGVYGDVPQVAVKPLKGLSLANAKDATFRNIFNMLRPREPSSTKQPVDFKKAISSSSSTPIKT